MSRAFNGGTSAEFIDCSPGNAPAVQGPITIAVLCQASTTPFTGWVIQGMTASGVWSILFDSGVTFMESDFTTGGPAHGLGWIWSGAGKASGSQIPRWHKHDLTAGTAWAHSNASGTVGNNTGPITKIRIGSSAAGSAAQTFRGTVAAVAVWNALLSDVAFENACTLAAADLAASSPAWGVLLNQATTATPVSDFTAGGGNQTGITGTTVSANEPPGWSYALGGSPPVGRQLIRSQAVKRGSSY